MNVSRANDFFKEGLRNIMRYKMRSALTLLGVVFGIAAVITMMGIGEGLSVPCSRKSQAWVCGISLPSLFATQTNSTGSDASVRDRFDYGLTFRDARKIEAALEEIGATVNIAHQIKHSIYYRGVKKSAKTLGVNPDYWSMVHAEPVRGVWTAMLHEELSKKVAIINRDFFDGMDAMGDGLGETLKIGNQYFDVIGVVDVPAHRGYGYVYLPYQTAVDVFGDTFMKIESGDMEYSRTEIGQLIVQAPDEASVKAVAEVVNYTLQGSHELDDYTVYVPLNILESKQRTQRILNLVLVTIAAISLIVGGSGS